MLKLSPVQTDATLLDVTCCVYLHTLLHVVARSLKPGQTFKPSANRRNIVRQQLPTLLDFTCCPRLHTLLHVQTDATTSKIVGPTMLRVIAFDCT